MTDLRFTLSVMAIAALLPALSFAQTSMPGSAGSAGAGTSGSGYACTMQYDPVCGARQVQCIKAPCYSQYETFGNSCVMNAEGATFVHKGECTPEETGPVVSALPPPKPEPYKPPASCTSWNDGCNVCARGDTGSVMCTEKYCEQPGAGYCTATAGSQGSGVNPAPSIEPAYPVDIDGGIGDTPGVPSAPVFEKERGFSVFKFFSGAWNTVLLWLGF
jgi:hypothetical protein